MKALIVEPSRMIRNVLISLFAKNNVSAQAVDTGAAALAALAADSFDFLCFSMQLGDMTGIEFFTQAKAGQLIGKHPSVLLTSSDESVTTEAVAVGVTECFRKDERTVFEDYVERWAQSTASHLGGLVLLVEDSAIQAAHFERLLADLGLNTLRAAAGEQAMLLLAQQAFDLVIVDYVLEGTLTGLGVIRRIRKLPGRTGNLPILAISGFDDMARKIELLRSGANDFVQKPFVGEEFQIRVRNLVLLRQALDRLEEQHRILHDMAMQDRLTGAYNRHFLSENLPRLIHEARASQRPLAAIAVDIDHFKRINDNFSHAFGDTVLSAVAAVLRDAPGSPGLVVRLGGEEFAVILPGHDAGAAAQHAEQLREAIEELMPSGLRVTASFGAAQLQSGENWEDVYRRADAAMYEAKQEGRNRVVTAV